jgi:hypothetical protein
VLLTVGLGDVPTWVAAIGTVGALIAALVQIGAERRHRHESEAAAAEERRLSQARLVSAILGPEEGEPHSAYKGRTAVYLINGSDEPVYKIVVGIVFIQGAGPRSIEEMLKLRYASQPPQPAPVMTSGILPPGDSRVWIGGTGWSAILSGRSGAEVAFTDRSGGNWIRRATGTLEELPEDPLTYFSRFGMYGPHEFQVPEHFPSPSRGKPGEPGTSGQAPPNPPEAPKPPS